MRIIKNTLFLILIFIIPSCYAQKEIKEYYYQIGKKKEVSVYKYVDKNNPKNIEYWKVTTDPKTNTILTESYTTDFRLYNIFEEQLNTKGAEVIRYADFEQSDNGQNIRVNGIIVDKNVYKWVDHNKYKYSINYKSPRYGNGQVTKARTKNKFENIEVYGTKYATVKFMDEYEIKYLENGQNYDFYQFTYYAKGIGMVKYQRYHPDGTTIELELKDILTEKEFHNISKKNSRQ